MGYCTQADVLQPVGGNLDQLARLTDPNGTGELDADRLARAIAEADAWMNTFIVKRFGAPFSSTPYDPYIVSLSAAETVYRLKMWFRSDEQRDRDDHAERLLWLEQLADGRVGLSETEPAKSAQVAAKVLTRSDDPDVEPVSRSSMDGFV